MNLKEPVDTPYPVGQGDKGTTIIGEWKIIVAMLPLTPQIV